MTKLDSLPQENTLEVNAGKGNISNYIFMFESYCSVVVRVYCPTYEEGFGAFSH